MARRILGREDTRDASQEVWVRAWTNIKGFRGKSASGTCLHGIAMNTRLSLRQKETRRRQR